MTEEQATELLAKVDQLLALLTTINTFAEVIQWATLMTAAAGCIVWGQVTWYLATRALESRDGM